MTFRFDKERMTAFSPEGIPMGHVSFPQIHPHLVNISQVMARPGFRGQGVEDAMMEALLHHLTERNQKAALTAPYAQKYAAAHDGWKPLLPCSIHFTTH